MFCNAVFCSVPLNRPRHSFTTNYPPTTYACLNYIFLLIDRLIPIFFAYMHMDTTFTLICRYFLSYRLLVNFVPFERVDSDCCKFEQFSSWFDCFIQFWTFLFHESLCVLIFSHPIANRIFFWKKPNQFCQDPFRL